MSSSHQSNNHGAADALDLLGAWRERGLHRLDPVAFYLIEALARRAVGQGGDVRRILDTRIAELLASYKSKVDRAALRADETGEVADAGKAAPGLLAGLVDYMESRKLEGNRNPAAMEPPSGHGPALGRAAYPEIAELDYFRQAWLKLNTRRQFRHSQEQVPENAGPLNSDSLVHRALSLMHELAPGYLHHFLTHLDALAWMEELSHACSRKGKDAQRPGGARKSGRTRVG